MTSYDDGGFGRDGLSERMPETIGERPSVLVIEDQASLRELAVRILRDAGYQVTAAPTVEAAQAIVQALPAPPNVLLTDIVSPGLNGLTFAEGLRARNPNLRAIFMSGYSNTLVKALQRFGKGEILVKPFTPGDLLGKVHAALGRPDISRGS